jgi:MoaA/NifB/PqqE/SkfB family radical SAM enzyme
MDMYFNDMNNIHPVDINISGGEPTLSPYFLDIVELCASKALINDIFVITNGLYDPEIYIKADNIAKKNNKSLFVCISIHMSQLRNIENYIQKIKYLRSSNIDTCARAIVDPNKITEEMLLYLQSNYIKILPLFGSNIIKLHNVSDLKLYHAIQNKLLIHYDDNKEEICSLFDIRIQKHNPFKGYYCTSSFQNITVNEDGCVASACFLADTYSGWSKSKLRHFNIINRQHRKCILDICTCFSSPIRYKDIKSLPYLIKKQKEDIIKYGYD